MSLLEDALASPTCVLSVMGDHAGESEGTIFDRKKKDIESLGRTFWLIRSPKAKPFQIQEICRLSIAYTIFIDPSAKGGARPTTEEAIALKYSADGILWNQLPPGLGPVTGKLDTSATALVFDILRTDIIGKIDLWDYADLANPLFPIKFKLGCSTFCALKKDTSQHPEQMKSHVRQIVAVARLVSPYGAWVK